LHACMVQCCSTILELFMCKMCIAHPFLSAMSLVDCMHCVGHELLRLKDVMLFDMASCLAWHRV